MNCASSESELTVSVYNDDDTTTLGTITWAYGTHGSGASADADLPVLTGETGLSLTWSSSGLAAAVYEISVSDANSVITNVWTITVSDCVSATISAD
mmetsp:Transcript_13214/g.1184  ORF Transcript_13214/g.1184 Transcript_13214/m.1184 type:complete len:97 (+) Transcript_13214:1109-1399(+)